LGLTTISAGIALKNRIDPMRGDFANVTLALRYRSRSRLRLLSLSNSEKRTAFDRMIRSICEVEQLPVCSRTTFAAGPM
jgi:hypothetical protein